MTIREDVVSSAISFLLDPNVVSSSIDSKLSFLRSKNLTQEEIDAAFARTGGPPPPAASSTAVAPVASQHQQPYYSQQQYTQPPPYGWQEPTPAAPKRDWRDWFIMATVVGGVGYGLYFMSKRYLYPLVAPPTPQKLDQDKTTVDEQFEKAFAALEQLAKDTDTLKESEAARTEKLDKVLEDLENFMRESKSASRRQEDETERLRDDIKNINTAMPKSMTAHKDFTDNRLKEISNEVKSLRSLISQRMNPTPASAASPATGSTATTNGINTLRSTSTMAASVSPVATPSIEVKENGSAQGEDKTSPTTSTPSKQDYLSSLGGQSTPFGAGAGTPKIPAWQMAANTNKAASSGTTTNDS